MRAFGCDIGNGFAFVSIMDADANQPMDALPQSLGGSGLPTDALIGADGSITVGRRTVRSSQKRGRVLRAAKRALAGRDTDSMFAKVDPAHVYAAIAQRALDESFTRLSKRGYTPPHAVVLTYPASFESSPRAINRIIDAVSGLVAPDGEPYMVCGVIPEPAAVALDYLSVLANADERSCAVVYDLGHGTFDTALVTVDVSDTSDGKSRWQVYDYDGLGNVGGVDFDDLVAHMLKQGIEDTGRAVPWTNADSWTVREAAIEAKEMLSQEKDWLVEVSLSDGTAYEQKIPSCRKLAAI